ncbi:MAG TPA: HhH-GPD-type base excision DNA repair protein [Candidatus Limnocylindria bacterium]|nr:HhH-GPD-type base excision DNA repair protein [Candidatus Limnocylindria bacterium]
MVTDRLHYTGDDEADRLLVSEPMALLIGFALDQQVPVPKAFSGPKVLLERLGTLDARKLATIDEAKLEAAAKGPPAIHRFPSAMAKRVRELASYIADTYDGDAARLWTDASDGLDLARRIGAMPGFGEMKVRSLIAVLGKRLGVHVPGMDEVMPSYPTLGDVDSAEALADYQAKKRAYKAKLRESGEAFEPWANRAEAAEYAKGRAR